MAGSLKSHIFISAQNLFKKRCLTLFIDAYNLSILENLVATNLEENDISAILRHLIDENPVRKKWKISSEAENYRYDKTMNKYIKGFAAKQSRIDFKFGNFWNEEEFEYFIEAKNLKAKSSNLKRRYINTGINNFLSGGKYQDCDGFLVGYIVEGNIKDCKDGINKLLQKDNRKTEVLANNTFLGFDLFSSNHSIKNLNHLFLLYTN